MLPGRRSSAGRPCGSGDGRSTGVACSGGELRSEGGCSVGGGANEGDGAIDAAIDCEPIGVGRWGTRSASSRACSWARSGDMPKEREMSAARARAATALTGGERPAS